ncbi:hypothetical protein [Ferdinandcohnia sp. Marseille-Q9671]
MDKKSSLLPLHSDIFWDALRLSKMFVKEETYFSKKELQYVLLKRNGSLYASNGITGMKVEEAHFFLDDFLIDPISFDMFMGHSFDISQFFRRKEIENEIDILHSDLYYWLNAVRELKEEIINDVEKVRNDKSIPVYLELLNNNKLIIRYDNQLSLIGKVLPYKSILNKTFIRIKLNIYYIIHCLKVMVLLNQHTSNYKMFVKKDQISFQEENGFLETILCLMKDD